MILIAQIGLISILSLFLVFHFLILVRVIPFTIVWGGRLKTVRDMYRFEIVSILLNCFFLVMILIQAQILNLQFPDMLTTSVLWIMVILFALNTLGNLASKNKWEKRIFTPITLIMSLLALALVI